MTNLRSYFIYDDFGEILQISETLDIQTELKNSKGIGFVEVPTNFQNLNISAVKKLYVDLSDKSVKNKENIDLDFYHPVKELFWIVRRNYSNNVGDKFTDFTNNASGITLASEGTIRDGSLDEDDIAFSLGRSGTLSNISFARIFLKIEDFETTKMNLRGLSYTSCELSSN